MKKKRIVRLGTASKTTWVPVVLVLSLFFMIGTLFGCYCAGNVSNEECSALIAYLKGYLSATGSGSFEQASLLKVLWEIYRWPLLVFFFSFTAAGIIGIPLLFSIRGFLFSVAVAFFVRVFGGTGAIVSFILFGITGAISIPVLFVIGAQGMTACRLLAVKLAGGKRKTAVYDKYYFGRCGICAAFLAVGVCLEQTVVPSLMMVLAGTF